ncbi:predicted protein [Sclerotinia sclerotiorum 1980 UF-70]|uniref:Uncharacterized protein n=1 Tax=Sclerotinia sclerotiorum (strain ATCC 18683 / 1980 / Ss-1) TaxID=665079 RepID=A7F0U5_SCLS1|nr:predicted protein [Sclerotinia sclerotiorum 1980 UF-70]EDN95337.1 predicted protein [Sclerotinia sclerotiorum 1980 UF-70]
MNNSSKDKKSDSANNLTVYKDQRHSKVITFKATFLKNNKEKTRMIKASEATIFDKLPLIQLANSEGRSDQENGTLEQAKPAKIEKCKKSEIVDLTEEKAFDQVKVEEETQSTRSSQKLNKDQLTSTPKRLEKESQSPPMTLNAKEKTKPDRPTSPIPTARNSKKARQPPPTKWRSKKPNQSTTTL